MRISALWHPHSLSLWLPPAFSKHECDANRRIMHWWCLALVKLHDKMSEARPSVAAMHRSPAQELNWVLLFIPFLHRQHKEFSMGNCFIGISPPPVCVRVYNTSPKKTHSTIGWEVNGGHSIPTERSSGLTKRGCTQEVGNFPYLDHLVLLLQRWTAFGFVAALIARTGLVLELGRVQF